MKVTYAVATITKLDILVELLQEFYQLEQISFDESIHRKALRGLIENQSLGRVWLIYFEAIAIGYVAIVFDYSIGRCTVAG
jgi:diamine N-acetyltransferase